MKREIEELRSAAFTRVWLSVSLGDLVEERLGLHECSFHPLRYFFDREWLQFVIITIVISALAALYLIGSFGELIVPVETLTFIWGPVSMLVAACFAQGHFWIVWFNTDLSLMLRYLDLHKQRWENSRAEYHENAHKARVKAIAFHHLFTRYSIMYFVLFSFPSLCFWSFVYICDEILQGAVCDRSSPKVFQVYISATILSVLLAGSFQIGTNRQYVRSADYKFQPQQRHRSDDDELISAV